jgi:hypothetical protein
MLESIYESPGKWCFGFFVVTCISLLIIYLVQQDDFGLSFYLLIPAVLLGVTTSLGYVAYQKNKLEQVRDGAISSVTDTVSFAPAVLESVVPELESVVPELVSQGVPTGFQGGDDINSSGTFKV